MIDSETPAFYHQLNATLDECLASNHGKTLGYHHWQPRQREYQVYKKRFLQAGSTLGSEELWRIVLVSKRRFTGASRFAVIIASLALTSSCTVMLEKEKEGPAQISIGTIEKVEPVSLETITKYDLVGGYVGLVNASSMASKDPEIDRHLHLDTRRYTIRDERGRVLKYVTDKAFFVEGDCVAIEREGGLNLRLVGDGICKGGSGKKRELSKIEKAAALCALDKRQLIIALSDKQIKEANRRIHADCQYDLQPGAIIE